MMFRALRGEMISMTGFRLFQNSFLSSKFQYHYYFIPENVTAVKAQAPCCSLGGERVAWETMVTSITRVEREEDGASLLFFSVFGRRVIPKNELSHLPPHYSAFCFSLALHAFRNGIGEGDV